MKFHFLFLLTFSLLQSAAVSPAFAKGGPQFPPRWLELELEEVPGAALYELEFKSKRTGRVSNFKVEKAFWRAKIQPGTYEMRLRSYDQRKVPGPWSDYQTVEVSFPGPEMLSPIKDAHVLADQDDDDDVELKWENIEGVQQYRVEIKNEEGKTWEEFSNSNSLTLSLPVAHKYTWNVYALRNKKDKGEGSDEDATFALIGPRLKAPEITEPEDRYVTEVNWERPEHTEHFTYALARLQGSNWKLVEKKTQEADVVTAPVPLELPGGMYRLQVRAEADMYQTSSVAAVEFEVFEGKRDPASVEVARLRESMEKPTNWYAIASYYITNVTYSGLDSEGAENVSYDAVGGTGRVGAGYFAPQSEWGGIGIVDLSGFNLGGKNVTYSAVEAHAAWRRYYGINQLRLSGGLFYKELNETTHDSPTATQFTYSKVSYMGPHVGFDFWRPISSKLGWQLNGRLYLSALGNTPNGNNVLVTPSYQLGVRGSYKLRHNVMGFLGYAYRRDAVKYESSAGGPSDPLNFAKSGDHQEISMSGHYLNLLLEWGF